MYKKPLKIILSILLTLIFICSVLFNIVAFNSSYASLMFRYDKNSYQTMHSIAASKLEYSNVKDGLYVKGQNVNGCSSFEAQYNVENDIMETKTTCKIGDVTSTYYYKNNSIYNQNGEILEQDVSFDYFVSEYPNIFTHFLDITLWDVDLNGGKTKIDFSFSPFYTLGIKFSFFKTETLIYTYKYDLKGRIRKIEAKDDTSKASILIDYKKQNIDFPR